MDSPDNSSIASDRVESTTSPTNKRVPLSESFDLCGKMIKLVVGEGDERTILQVHQDVLSRNSGFFKAAVKPEWAERRDEPDSIDLSVHSIEDVKAYAHWLYAGTLPTRDFDNTGDTKSDPIWIDLAQAYVFGEKMIDRKYQKAILETFAAVQVEAPDFPCAETFTIIYDGTPEGSPVRKLLIDMWACGAWDAPDWKQEIEGLPHEALVDVMRATVKVRTGYYRRKWVNSVEEYIGDKSSAQAPT